MVAAKAIHAYMESMAFEVSGQIEADAVAEAFVKAEQLFIDGLLLPGSQHHDE